MSRRSPLSLYLHLSRQAPGAPHCLPTTEVNLEGLSPCDSAPASSLLSLGHPHFFWVHVPVPSTIVRRGLLYFSPPLSPDSVRCLRMGTPCLVCPLP